MISKRQQFKIFTLYTKLMKAMNNNSEKEPSRMKVRMNLNKLLQLVNSWSHDQPSENEEMIVAVNAIYAIA